MCVLDGTNKQWYPTERATDQKRCTCAFSDGMDKWPILLFWLEFLLSSLYILVSDLLLLQSTFLQVELTKLQMWLRVQNWFSFYSYLCLVSTVYHSSCKIRLREDLKKNNVVLCADKKHAPFPSALWILLIRSLWKIGKQQAPSLDKDQQSVLLMAIQGYIDTHSYKH